MASDILFFFHCLVRRSEEEVDMDKVTAAMVLTSLSTSPLVRSPPVKVSGEFLHLHTPHIIATDDKLGHPADTVCFGT